MISYIVATIGDRSSLLKTLQSIECWEGDELLVIGNVNPELVRLAPKHATFVACEPGGDWGGAERNLGMSIAKGQYISFMDDDDVSVPGARASMQDTIDKTPNRPAIFKMYYPHSRMLIWNDPEIRCGNVGTPMIFVPNDQAKLGVWSHRYETDFGFLESWKWTAQDVVWRPEVIAHIRP